MRARGAEAEASAVRSARRRAAEVDCGEGGRERIAERSERPAAPRHSTFRRVAVFVPLR